MQATEGYAWASRDGGWHVVCRKGTEWGVALVGVWKSPGNGARQSVDPRKRGVGVRRIETAPIRGAIFAKVPSGLDRDGGRPVAC